MISVQNYGAGDIIEFLVVKKNKKIMWQNIMNGNITHNGEANMGNPLGKSSIFKSIQAGNWASIINAMVKSCA